MATLRPYRPVKNRLADFLQVGLCNFFLHHGWIQEITDFRFLKHKPTRAVK